MPKGAKKVMVVPGINVSKIPKRYVPVAVMCLDQGATNFGYVVLYEEALLKCGQKDRDLLLDALEGFCARLRQAGGQSTPKPIN